MDREFEFFGIKDKVAFTLSHDSTTPRHNGILIDAKRLVGDDEVGVDAENLAEAFASGAGTERVVEGEHSFGREFEFDAIGFERFGEFGVNPFVTFFVGYGTILFTFEESSFDRVVETIAEFVGVVDCYAVNNEIE